MMGIWLFERWKNTPVGWWVPGEKRAFQWDYTSWCHDPCCGFWTLLSRPKPGEASTNMGHKHGACRHEMMGRAMTPAKIWDVIFSGCKWGCKNTPITSVHGDLVKWSELLGWSIVCCAIKSEPLRNLYRFYARLCCGCCGWGFMVERSMVVWRPNLSMLGTQVEIFRLSTSVPGRSRGIEVL